MKIEVKSILYVFLFNERVQTLVKGYKLFSYMMNKVLGPYGKHGGYSW